MGGEGARNPYLHFLRSEAWGAGAGLGVYLIFRLASWLADVITVHLPLADPAPAEFFTLILGWGGSLGGSATFVVITAYQLVVLVKRLWSEVVE